jgi:cell division protein FtsQ
VAGQGPAALIDAEGVVLDKVPVDKMPDLPLLIGPGANSQARALDALLGKAPTLKPQLVSATWVGQRRWDLNFQTGETVALARRRGARATALPNSPKGQVGGPARARDRPLRPAQFPAR